MSQRTILLVSLASVLLFMALYTAPSVQTTSTANAQSDLSIRVSELEAQIADLTVRIERLEDQVGIEPTPTPTTPPTSTTTSAPDNTEPTANLNANLRGGPDTTYDIVGSTRQGQVLNIVACNPACDWYQLADGAWIAGFLVDNAPANLPTITVDEPASASAAVEVNTSTPPTPTPTPQPPTATPQPSVITEVCNCSGNTNNCSDFNSQADAQACFAYCVNEGRGDIHRLDADNDNLACESLP